MKNRIAVVVLICVGLLFFYGSLASKSEIRQKADEYLSLASRSAGLADVNKFNPLRQIARAVVGVFQSDRQYALSTSAEINRIASGSGAQRDRISGLANRLAVELESDWGRGRGR